jgi:hypothetical protein
MSVLNKMGSTEVTRAGVREAVAFLLSEISTLLEKECEERETCLRQDRLSKRNASCVPSLMNGLVSEHKESHKNHLRMSNHSSFDLYNHHFLRHSSSTS